MGNAGSIYLIWRFGGNVAEGVLRMYNQKGHLLVLWENQESVLTAHTHGGSAH